LPRPQFRSTVTSGAFMLLLTLDASNGTGVPRRNTIVPWSIRTPRSGPTAAGHNPAAETIRPQLGSLPCMAHFTSGEFAMARAIALATDSDLHPRTRMVTSWVALPPPAGFGGARVSHISSSEAARARADG